MQSRMDISTFKDFNYERLVFIFTFSSSSSSANSKCVHVQILCLFLFHRVYFKQFRIQSSAGGLEIVVHYSVV